MTSPSDSLEARLREMTADRLLETVQFATSKEDIVESGSSTALLLSMAQTLRACMRDWPNMEDNILAGVERAEALVHLKRTLKEARRLTRSSPLESLVFVCSDALFQIAEQWPVAKGAASQGITQSFPQRKRLDAPSTCSVNPADNVHATFKKPRVDDSNKETHQTTRQFFPPYPEEDDEDVNAPGENEEIDPIMFLNGLVKEEADMSNGGRMETSIGQRELDIWSTQTPLAAFAAVTSSTSHSLNDRESEGSNRIRKNKLYCPECGVGCVAKSQLEVHMNSHTGNRPFQCNYCEKNYKRKDHLSDHIKKNHPTEHAAAKQKKVEMKNKSSAMWRETSLQQK